MDNIQEQYDRLQREVQEMVLPVIDQTGERPPERSSSFEATYLDQLSLYQKLNEVIERLSGSCTEKLRDLLSALGDLSPSEDFIQEMKDISEAMRSYFFEMYTVCSSIERLRITEGLLVLQETLPQRVRERHLEEGTRALRELVQLPITRETFEDRRSALRDIRELYFFSEVSPVKCPSVVSKWYK